MSSAFQTLLQEFAQSKGMAVEDSSYGLEFECEDTRVYVLQHPLHDDRLLCEVSVVAFGDEPGANVLSLLLQINEAARFDHDWTIVMDGDLEVSLTTAALLQGMNVAGLEALMLDGVERSQVLKGIVQEVIEAASQESAGSSAQASYVGGVDPMMMMRG